MFGRAEKNKPSTLEQALAELQIKDKYHRIFTIIFNKLYYRLRYNKISNEIKQLELMLDSALKKYSSEELTAAISAVNSLISCYGIELTGDDIKPLID